MLKTLIIVIVFFSGLPAAFSIESGTKAPAFKGNTLDGGTIKLEDYRGKVVLLDFWASWCGPCRKEMPFLAELYKEFEGHDFEILAVNIDKKKKNAEKFLKKLDVKIKFPVIWDKKKEIPPLYGIKTMPTTVLIDKKGNVRYIHDGFSESLKNQFRKEVRELCGEK